MPSAPPPALVLHVDMDAFFASVEMRSDPRLIGRPLAVGGTPSGRGVVTTASYAAREYGVRSGMAMAEAVRRCPHLLALPVDGPKYMYESLEFLRVLDRISPKVEAASIDEAYLELEPPPHSRWEEQALQYGNRIRRDMLARRGLSCSVGAGVNKLQAKMATPLAKPGGVSVIPRGRFLDLFRERAVSLIPGVGPKSTEALARLGVRTIGELAAAPLGVLETGFGRWARMLRGHSMGNDASQVYAFGEGAAPRSAGHETTFARDVSDPDGLRATLWFLADRVARRLRGHGYLAQTVVVRFRIGKQKYSRQQRLDHPTDDGGTMARLGWGLLEASRKGRPLRLLGIAGAGLRTSTQEPLPFSNDHSRRQMVRAGDRVRNRFGESAVLPGTVHLKRRVRS